MKVPVEGKTNKEQAPASAGYSANPTLLLQKKKEEDKLHDKDAIYNSFGRHAYHIPPPPDSTKEVMAAAYTQATEIAGVPLEEQNFPQDVVHATQRKRSDLAHKDIKSNIAQLASFMSVKRVANNGNLYTGKNSAGPPALNHAGGTNWFGPKATAFTYGTAPGGVWRVTANSALNLIDMGSAASVKAAMDETARRRGLAGLSVALNGVLGNFDFAYAIPNAVATVADGYLRYANIRAAGNVAQWPGDAHNVTQQDVDDAIDLALQLDGVASVPLTVGSIIQAFAGHTGVNAVRLDNVNFLANPDGYRIVRKDATNLDAGFANALLSDLNDPTLFHGLHVPAGTQFGGWTGSKLEILIKDAPNNLTLQNQVQQGGNEADLALSDKTIAVDDSKLAKAWRFLGGNK